MVFVAVIALAASVVTLLASVAARDVAPGEAVIALFPPRLPAAAVIERISRVRPRQYMPLGFGNGWLIRTQARANLHVALRKEGAIVILKAAGPLPFALGCTVARPQLLYPL